MSLGFPCSRAYFADLLENIKEEIEIEESAISIRVEPKKIITLVLY